MNISVIFFFCFVIGGAFAASAADLSTKASVEELIKSCALESKISSEEVDKLKGNNISTDSENVKCFAKCFLNEGRLITESGFDLEKIVAFAVAKGIDATKAKEKALACKDLYKGVNDCETAFALLACFKKE